MLVRTAVSARFMVRMGSPVPSSGLREKPQVRPVQHAG